MASNYPSQYDTFPLPNSSDKTATSHSELHRNTSHAIEAVQSTLGLNPQNPNSTVAERLAAIQAQITMLQGEVDALSEGIIPTGDVQAAGTQGQIQYNDGGVLGALNNGTAGQLLVSNGAGVVPSFVTNGGLVFNDDYTPTLTNAAIGTGGAAANTASYTYIGGPNTGDRGILTASGEFVLGTSGASITGSILISLPSGFEHFNTTTNHQFGTVLMNDGDGGTHIGVLRRLSDNDAFAIGRLEDDGSNNLILRGLTNSTPFTWAAGDSVRWCGTAPVIRV